MRSGLFVAIAVVGLSLVGSTQAEATERYNSSTVKWVYPLANGDFVIVFDTDEAFCTGSGPGKSYYVTVGQNGITSEGSKKLYAAALTAVTTRMPVDIAFDDATTSCYINRLIVKSS